jgi:hypothetical protein
MEVYSTLADQGTSQPCFPQMVSWRAFNDVVGLEEAYAQEEHHTSVQGPSSDVTLRVKVKAGVKPVSMAV